MRSLRQGTRATALRSARTCYDHLAGRVGVSITQALIDNDALAPARVGERPLLRFCVDWSEQRHHLAGRLGADVCAALIHAGWVRRRARERAVVLTDVGSPACAVRSACGCEPVTDAWSSGAGLVDESLAQSGGQAGHGH